MNRLLSFISEKFNGVIWRMEIDSLGETVFVEVRNSEEKMVSFGSVNLVSGKVNFKDLVTDERWFTGIEAAYGGVLLLHNYESATSPVHQGVIAVDACNGANLWSNYTYAFDHLSANGPILYNSRLQPKKLLVADIKTGGVKRNYDPIIDKDAVAPILLPQVLPASCLEGTSIKIEPFGNRVHYLEYNNFRIVSLHSFEAEKLQQHLFVLNDMDVVYEDILNCDIQKIQPEAFILYKNCLIYIKNKAELKALKL